MEHAVFINYRGEDSHSYGALLYNELKGQFGEDQVFLDAETIPAGADFAAELLSAVRSARVLLAVIGPAWLTVADPTGRRRIDNPDDWIRRELTEAFAHGVRVIPVLTDLAELPSQTDLPADIAALSHCQYRHLRSRESTSDLARIVADLIGLDRLQAATALSRDNASGHLPLMLMNAATGGAGGIGTIAWATAPAVDEYLRLLAAASWHQWTAAANNRRLVHPAPLPIRWRRSTAPVAGPESAATYPRFDPLPGLPAIGSSELREGDKAALHGIYGGLPSGRLLLIGDPGSGKTAAAILLLLNALRHRQQATPEDQARMPVPVLFTLHGWNPDRGESVTDWMAGKLAETYPMFRSRAGRHAATGLLATGRVAGFLDGLDEIPESVRPRVLTALADAPFRLVLLTRTAEAVVAANHGPLAGAVALELQPVQPTDAASYLLQSLVNPPPDPWRMISDHLTGTVHRHRPTSVLSQALATPLNLSLLRDVYGPTGPVDELLDTARFPTAADIENHLLDQAITAAYTPRPGHPQPRYTVATAHRTLRYLANYLTEQHNSDLAWWHIPTWITHRSRIVAAAVASTLGNMVMYGLPLGLVLGPVFGLAVGLVFGLVGVFALSTRNWRGVSNMPRQFTRLTYRNASPTVATFGLTGALIGGLLVGLTVGLVFGFSASLVPGLSVGLATGLVSVAGAGLVRHTDVEASSLSPADVWRHDRNAGLVLLPMTSLLVGLVAILAASLVPGLASALASRSPVVLWIAFSFGLVWGLVATLMVKRVGVAASSPGAAALETALTAAQLTIRHKTPLRLIAFLEDARSKHLLRTVGPVYQFRHAKLQARLVQPTSRDCPRSSSGLRPQRALHDDAATNDIDTPSSTG